MLWVPARHEALQPGAWDEALVRDAIARSVAETESAFTPEGWWPPHLLDLDPTHRQQPLTPFYFGAGGVIWALHRLQDLGAVRLTRDYRDFLPVVLARNRAILGAFLGRAAGSYLMGDTPFLMMALDRDPADAETEAALEAVILGMLDNLTLELMWGSPGTLLACLFLYRRTGRERWAELFRLTAERLRDALLWSDQVGCHYWTQQLYGHDCTYLDAVHGFIATASVLIRGLSLLGEDAATGWCDTIVRTVERTASHEGGLVNWRPQLLEDRKASRPLLMQFCHGAPGFIVCLGDFPDDRLDPLLLAAGEAVWAAGPLVKGSNLCHGTAGNGYAFLTLYRRTRDPHWLGRARAFAMHAIGQMDHDRTRFGQGRYSLWTGDAGAVLYWWDCLRGEAAFPGLEVFFGAETAFAL